MTSDVNVYVYLQGNEQLMETCHTALELLEKHTITPESVKTAQTAVYTNKTSSTSHDWVHLYFPPDM